MQTNPILTNFHSNLYSTGTTNTKPPVVFQHTSNKPKEMSKAAKAGVIVTTLAGVATAFLLLAKSHKMKPLQALKNMNYENKEIMSLAAGSVTGGLIGGLMFDDKKNMKAKTREAIVQMLGNISTPLICVNAVTALYRNGAPKLAKKIIEVVPKSEKYIRNNFTKGLSKVIASGVALAVGIIGGNKASNWLNEEIFHVKDNRKVKLADFSAHIDDACLSVSLVCKNDKNVFSQSVSRIIPAALMVAGNSVGTCQDIHCKDTGNF